MSMYAAERQRKKINEKQRFHAAQRVKRELGQSATLRIHEELNAFPGVADFETPLLREDPLAIRILRFAPEEATRHIHVGRHVTLSLNESVQPPLVRIQLGDHTEQS